MGGQLPDDFFVWLEVLTGGESQILWQGESVYGTKFEQMLLQSLGSMSEVNKIKMWDGLYPKEVPEWFLGVLVWALLICFCFLCSLAIIRSYPDSALSYRTTTTTNRAKAVAVAIWSVVIL